MDLISSLSTAVLIPALNEEGSISKVIASIPAAYRNLVVVVDNGSTDHTALQARNSGAVVLTEPVRGYGRACLNGLDYLSRLETPPEVVVFLDGDFSDYPEEMPSLINPILEGKAHLVIGARGAVNRQSGSMTTPQIFGNWLSAKLIRFFYGVSFSDLGPFRAIRFSTLKKLDLRDKDFGWTVEMQVKAAKMKIPCMEVPVRYRKRIGKSKVSGTVKGTILAGYKILFTIFRNL